MVLLHLKNKANYYIKGRQFLSHFPGLTKAVIPTLLKKNIVAISVGVNDGTSPPDVPPIFNWKFDDEHSVIAMWIKGIMMDGLCILPISPDKSTCDDVH